MVNISTPQTLEQAIRKLARRTSIDDNGCHYVKYIKRYPQINVDGRMEIASRMVWAFHNGPIPDGMNVCHHCDNNSCINPDHLFLATQAENMQDCKRKGRHPTYSKLTEEQVREIKNAPIYIGCYDDLAKKYGVHYSTVYFIKQGLKWKWVK